MTIKIFFNSCEVLVTFFLSFFINFSELFSPFLLIEISTVVLFNSFSAHTFTMALFSLNLTKSRSFDVRKERPIAFK